MCFFRIGHAAATKLSDIILESVSVDDVEMSKTRQRRDRDKSRWTLKALL